MSDLLANDTAIGRVLQRARPPRRRAVPGLALGVLADASAVGLLGLSMWLIVSAAAQPPILFLNFAIVGVRAFAIGRAAFRYAERLSGHDAALRQLAALRAETFAALVPRVPGAIESRRRGDVLGAFVDDVDRLQDEPLRVRQPLVVSGVVVTLSVLALALISPLGAVILAAMLVLTGLLSAWLSRRIAAESDRVLAAAQAELSDALLERFSAAEVLAAFGALGVQRDRIAEAEARVVAAQLRRTRAAGLAGALIALGSGLATLLLMLALSPALGAGGSGVTAPLFAAAVVVPAAVFEVFAQIPVALIARRTVRASAARIAELTETPLPAEIPRDPEPMPSVTSPAAILREVPESHPEQASTAAPLLAVQNLSVRHPGAAAPVISDISFVLRPGETLVITGESGAGKSTLALALVRFLEYTGSYRLRNAAGALVEARELPGIELRGIVGLCEQQPHLFDADLRQNLKFANETADDAELEAVLTRVGLGPWLCSAGGLDARLGERGALVSGGQAQRIALARAILADFPVVILDEPTAGVDRELADRLLLDLLGAVPADRAVILITHTELPEGIPARRLALPVPATALSTGENT
ncbi:MAG: thiol reductant ABC exporter subunit CydC [Actinobacteria bacterium]|nr:thiol reductant ABC exporter subunit CydC [Actinomycetota bacterium]